MSSKYQDALEAIEYWGEKNSGNFKGDPRYSSPENEAQQVLSCHEKTIKEALKHLADPDMVLVPRKAIPRMLDDGYRVKCRSHDELGDTWETMVYAYENPNGDCI